MTVEPGVVVSPPPVIAPPPQLEPDTVKLVASENVIVISSSTEDEPPVTAPIVPLPIIAVPAALL